MDEFANEQIETEESIAFYLHDRFYLHDEDAAVAGRAILQIVMRNLEPEVYEDLYDLMYY